MLEINVEAFSTYIKYITAVNEYIYRESKFIVVDDIMEASVKVITIMGNLKPDSKSNKLGGTTKGGNKRRRKSSCQARMVLFVSIANKRDMLLRRVTKNSSSQAEKV